MRRGKKYQEVAAKIDRLQEYTIEEGVKLLKQTAKARFDETVEIDLSEIKSAHAGPYSPDRITEVGGFRSLIEKEKWPDNVSAVLLGSCTNSSYSDLYAAAQILEQAKCEMSSSGT